MSLYSEIKKYLLYLVGFFCLLLGVHMGVLYLYKDAITYPIMGGTMNIGVIGDTPSLDVLSVDTKLENNTNDMVLKFLYRGMGRYSLEEKKIVGDLANCNLDTFPNVRCTLNQDALWNDGWSITVEDVLATYALFKENAHNEATKTRLSVVDISEDKGDIIFRFSTNDITTLDILFLPILRKKDMGRFWGNNDFATLSFSGPYVFSERDGDNGTLILKRNPGYQTKKDMYFLDQVRFGFADTQKKVKKILSPDVWMGEVSDIGSWFTEQKYSRPVVYGVYLNAERIPKALRKALLYDAIAPMEFSQDRLIPRENIFLGEVPNAPKDTTETLFFQTAFSLGYTFGGTAPLPTPTKPATPKYDSLKYVTQPGNVSPLFLSSDLVEIQGTAPAGTTKVVVNDYALQGYRSTNRAFSYKARQEFKNLIAGENIYKIQFFAGTKLLAEERLTVFHSSDTAQLNTIKDEWIKKNTPVVEPPITAPPVADTDPKKLYDKNRAPLVFHIIVQSEVPLFQDIAEKLQTKLQDLAVGVDIQYLPLADIRKMVADQNAPYDIVLAGVNLGLFHYNIVPFFHSGQIKNGFNISRIRNATLDSTMEKLIEKLYYNAPDRLRAIETEIQKILESESIFFPIGTPEESWYVKNYVLWVRPPSFFPGKEMMFDLIAKSYFKEGYQRSSEPKTVLWFFLWLKNELFSST